MTEEQKTAIYVEFHKRVLGYLNGKLNNLHIAEDLCSDVFVKVYENLDTYDETKASLSTWIYQITKNTLIDYYRVRRVEVPFSEEFMTEDSEEGEGSGCNESEVELEVCNNEMLEALASALETLSEKEREVIILHYYSGLRMKEIADKMGISLSYIKTLHGKALEHLKKVLE